MAEPNPNPNPNPPPSLLSTLGEELVRIITPVSACMLLVVLLVLSLSQSQTLTSSSPSSIATIAYSESTSDSTLDKLKGALFNSLVFVAVITVTTFLLLLLFYFRFTTFLKSYLSFSVFVVLAFLGGQTLLLLIQAFTFPIDIVTFLILLANVSVVGVMAVFLVKMPLVVTQGYLVVIGVLVAYWFTMLPEWTTWALLVAMSVYDLAAVLLPGGPLRLLVELAISRDEELPALVYEARPVEVTENSRRRIWRGNQNSTSNNAVESAEAEVNQSSEMSLESSMEFAETETETETRLVIAEERRVEVEVEVEAPLVGRNLLVEEEDKGIGLGSGGAIKLGLGDFIFYSVLVGRAALYDMMTVYACYLAIIAGLGITLLLLAVYRKALPALPVSIMFGCLFYLLSRMLLEVFVVQCSMNLLMF